MADIKIEKKGGSLWWLWALIALIVLALLAWFLLFNHNDRNAQAVATAPAAQQTDMTPVDRAGPVDAQPITDMATITSGNDAQLVGRNVQLGGAPVGEMAGDASFWITGADGKREYVVLNEAATPGTPVEGRVNVNQGDKVDIVGTLMAASDGAPQGAAMGTKTDPLPAGITNFIYAQSVKVVS